MIFRTSVSLLPPGEDISSQSCSASLPLAWGLVGVAHKCASHWVASGRSLDSLSSLQRGVTEPASPGK